MREVRRKRSHIKELSQNNRQMRSSKIHAQTLDQFTEKKSNARLTKYLTDRDKLAELALQNAKERKVKHLKKDEVAAMTQELQSQQAAKKSSK